MELVIKIQGKIPNKKYGVNTFFSTKVIKLFFLQSFRTISECASQKLAKPQRKKQGGYRRQLLSFSNNYAR